MRFFVCCWCLWVCGAVLAENVRLETKYFAAEVSEAGQVVSAIDKRSGENLLNRTYDANFCRLTMNYGEGLQPITSVKKEGNVIRVTFRNGVVLGLEYVSADHWFTLEVVSLEGADKEPYLLEFGRIWTETDYTRPDALGISPLILTIHTNVFDMPGKARRLGGMCYGKIGILKAKTASLALPEKEMRAEMKAFTEKILAQKEADPEYRKIAPPVSRAGGGYAMDIPKNYGSYIITSIPIKAEEVASWAEHLAQFGVSQIDFHQGVPFRQGDFHFNETAYPNGISDFRRMTDELKKHGMIAGLHTYSQFVYRQGNKYLTPVPHQDLDVMETFTLAEDMDEKATALAVLESTENVSTVTGFGVRNSLYLWIDDEIVVYREVGTNGFPKIERGAMGTKAVAHRKGAKVAHLTQYFHGFAPRPGSALFLEIARNTAKTYDAGGFSMIYLDALDGTNSLLVGEDKRLVWYYDALFVREILDNITTEPPLLEYSTMHASLWAARSRMGAWDSPSRGYVAFFDKHFASNAQTAVARYLPGQMGWFAVCPTKGENVSANFSSQTLFREDLEYLGVKSLAWNHGMSYLDISLGQLVPAAYRNGLILKTFDGLRSTAKISDADRELLKTPGKHFHLADGKLLPAQYVSLQQGGSVCNPYANQKPFIRIESRLSVGEYDDSGNIELAAFDENAPVEKTITKTFEEPLNLSQHLAMGMWVYGDGGGQWLNVRVESPYHLTSGFADHVVKLDFTGWKYLSFLENTNGEHPQLRWPAGRNGLYTEFRQKVFYNQISQVHVMVLGETKNLRFRTLKAIPAIEAERENPTLTINGQSVTFAGKIPAGCYAQWNLGEKEISVLHPRGEEVGKLTVSGDVPTFQNGENDVQISLFTRWTFGVFDVENPISLD
ncbi:MAG: hypothetical protein Q4D62_00245 [Planctomycetia bacterium]|nr:hypothetical protein [Planctomycetia bacterium]